MAGDPSGPSTRVESLEPEQKPKPTVLEMSQVSFRGRSENGIQLRLADLRLRAGDVSVVQLDSSTRTREFASMIQGLVPPGSGRVTFCEQDWLGNDHGRHFRMRSRIGRVFDGQAWIENLNVDENVTLSRRHHGADRASIDQELRYWLSKLAIKSISRKRPAFVEPSVLQLHQWVRAFLGSPAMLILERPLQFVSSEWLPRFIEAIDELRSRGTAVLWFTSSSQVLASSERSRPWMRLTWKDEKFQPLDGGSDNE